jgi:hypothetical protein
LTYLGFVLRENLLLYSSKPSLGVSNCPVIYFINYTPASSLALFITAPSNTKTVENRELALWHLVNRSVPENA